MEHLQQVREASIEREQARARQIGTEPPRCALHIASRGPHDLDSLIQALGRQHSLFSLLATAADNSPFAIGFVLPRDHDISAVHSAVVPLLFNEMAIGEEQSAEACQNNEEDASACVAACGGGCQRQRV